MSSRSAAWILGLALLQGAPASAVAIDWTFVGNPGNACETQSQGCFGAVAYPYQISTYEVTNSEYAEFLNAVAATDPNTLYSTSMSAGFGGITRTGASGSFTYGAISVRADVPVNFVSFYDALRFANWLNNGQPTGAQTSATTEDGAYTFSGATTVGSRNPGAKVFLTSEDEWYKAAYYVAAGAGYLPYPTGSSAQTICAAPTVAANRANCGNVVGDLRVGGSYPNSASPYGTFDQGGNVYELNESIPTPSSRAERGGTFLSSANILAASSQSNVSPTSQDATIGFRVAPEPGRDSTLLAGILALALTRWRRAHA